MEVILRQHVDNLGRRGEIVKVADVRAAMKKEKLVVSGDAQVLDQAGAWFNLVGRVLEGIPSAKIVELQ